MQCMKRTLWMDDMLWGRIGEAAHAGRVSRAEWVRGACEARLWADGEAAEVAAVRAAGKAKPPTPPGSERAKASPKKNEVVESGRTVVRRESGDRPPVHLSDIAKRAWYVARGLDVPGGLGG